MNLKINFTDPKYLLCSYNGRFWGHSIYSEEMDSYGRGSGSRLLCSPVPPRAGIERARWRHKGGSVGQWSHKNASAIVTHAPPCCQLYAVWSKSLLFIRLWSVRTMLGNILNQKLLPEYCLNLVTPGSTSPRARG